MVHGLPNINRASRASVDPGERVGNQRGDFGGQTVDVGAPKPRAAGALKMAWLDIRHSVTSLLGIRVSTSRPAQVTDAASAARGVLHAMTRNKVDTLDVAENLSALLEHGNFDLDASRDGLTKGAADLFEPLLSKMSDLQLKRLHSNMDRRPVLMEGLAQVGSAAAMAAANDDDDDDESKLKGGGRVNDLGFATLALRDGLMKEVETRGLKLDEPRKDPDASDRGLTLLAKHAVANGGKLPEAIADARRDLAAEKLDKLNDTLGELGINS